MNLLISQSERLQPKNTTPTYRTAVQACLFSYTLPFSLVQVKKAVVEMYDATKRGFVRSLAKHLASARTRILHVSIDLWTAKASVHKDKFIGKMGISKSTCI